MKTNLKNSLIIFLFFILPCFIFSQAESIFNGIKLGESLETVQSKVSTISKTLNVISIDNPTFPLAKELESHLISTYVRTEQGTLEQVVFTFADNKLSYIEARGNVYIALASERSDTSRTYMDYEVYYKDKLFLNRKKDIAWILNDECLHMNLFTWENPYLNEEYKIKTSKSNIIPSFIKMGENIELLRPEFEANSAFTDTEELDGSDPNAQLQINCFGVEYLGFPRKMEARFGDDILNVVWILTAKGEENRIRQSLIAQFGDPIYSNEAWEIYNDWQVGLRKDKPEVLLMTKEIGLFYKKEYFKQ